MSSLRPLLLLLLPLCPGPGGEAKATRSCAETRQVLGARGYSLSLLPPTLISGEHLRVCPQEYTCCSSETEQKLTRETEDTFRGLVEESGSFLVHTLAARHRKFNEFFQELLSASERSLSQLFSRSYGRLFVQHAPVFSELFSQLRGHYRGTSAGLDDALSEFWAQLLERAFPLLHPQYSFPPDYLLCLARLSVSPNGQLQPFGDSPRRLRLQVTRALVAARAFVQGLAIGRDVVSSALKVPMSEACVQAVMRLTGCPLCQGAPSLRPCRGFCLNVVQGCLSRGGLEPDWGSYLDTLLLLAERLQGPFSFELASESIGVKISEGLMFLQENSVGISAQVFQGCGGPHPAPVRSRRAPSPQDEVNQLWTFPPEEEWPTTAAGTNLPRLVWELRERLQRVRGFWTGLPLTLCGDPRMSMDVTEEAMPCWTGAGWGRYLPPVVGNSLAEQIKNPELEVDISGPNLSTRRQRLQLRAATARMRAAALGHDLDLQDADEDASGSGEGQHYADDWTARAAAVAPPARPPRRDTPVGKGSGGSSRYNHSGARSRVASRNFPTHPFLLLLLPVALFLLGPW
ncbi:glypican-2-like [Vombatus ursinus]|uniref:Glypican 2 n=1 Tax=Vombatus ursinus TaxID=29139 RepID=A0A4X2M551_VOMUR|nr:glypican-2-like [Vombatus ursinus]XP_027704188.1 glypican-2-like [Vombatus ursinus]